MKCQVLRLPIFTLSVALRYSCLKKKGYGYFCPVDTGGNVYDFPIHPMNCFELC